MKKLSLLFIAFIFSFQLLAQSKVGTIDIEYILSKMPELVQVGVDVKTYSDELDNLFQVKYTKYQVLINVYQENETGYTDAEKKTKQDEIIDLENEMQQFQQNSSTLIKIRQNELLRPLYMKISEALNVVSNEEKFTQVFTVDNTIVYLDTNFDITITVMKKIGLPID
ncbi:MAG: OmpH family outer membrane protein [Bacteroidetes bacterium]|nr:OmpH family outer membrane protein [Bacteroidota bacterium]